MASAGNSNANSPTEPDAQPSSSTSAPTEVSWIGPLVKLALLGVLLVFYIRNSNGSVDRLNDFTEQWTLAHLVAQGEWNSLYNREHQKEVIRQNLPARAPNGDDQLGYLENELFQGVIQSPYPPSWGLLLSPLGALSLNDAQRSMVFLHLLLAVVWAWAVCRVLGHRWKFSSCLLVILLYPGFLTSIANGQNAMLTLLIITLAWRALQTQHPIVAGLLLSTLLYKPTWLIAVSWIPLMVGRPKVYLGLLAGVAGWIGITAMVLGPQVWTHWWVEVLKYEQVVGQTAFYQEMAGRSCDLRSLILRYDSSGLSKALSWILLGTVALLGGFVSWYRMQPNQTLAQLQPSRWFEKGLLTLFPSRPLDQPASGLILMTAVLIMPYLIFYDVSVLLLPLLILLSWQSHYPLALRWALLALSPLFFIELALMFTLFGNRWQGPPIPQFIHLPLFFLTLACVWTARPIAPIPSEKS